ncbi:hypothetical protein N7523_000784 [Penicillium sp. IBT 18751x]|nr:hypothetical protein N7523_000784 [Penicillium sp. IBT 18751x]
MLMSAIEIVRNFEAKPRCQLCCGLKTVTMSPSLYGLLHQNVELMDGRMEKNFKYAGNGK